jgi:thiol-disulfide isomerase/thioredoxin
MLLSFGFATAQNSSVNILKRTVNKMQSLKSISYEQGFTNVNPFSQGDTSIGISKISLVFDGKGLIKAMNEKTTINNGQNRYSAIYKLDTLFSVDFNDSTYSYSKITKKGNVNCDLTSIANFIKETIKYSSKIIKKKDTIISNIPCYNFFIKTYDKIENNKHNYVYNYLLINKKTLMPVYTKETGEGTMEKEGHIIGRVTILKESYFRSFRINQDINNSVFNFNKTGFELENEAMLTSGSIAPSFNIKDLNNQTVPLSKFRDKVILVEFGSVDCGANPLANPMLNNLNKKYTLKEFSIVSIFSSESAEQIKKYAQANNLQFPVYLGNKKLKRDFKTIATPNFYLIDKNGTIIKGFNGFSDELEAELTKLIDSKIQ